jgi:hypothetical protein
MVQYKQFIVQYKQFIVQYKQFIVQYKHMIVFISRTSFSQDVLEELIEERCVWCIHST